MLNNKKKPTKKINPPKYTGRFKDYNSDKISMERMKDRAPRDWSFNNKPIDDRLKVYERSPELKPAVEGTKIPDRVRKNKMRTDNKALRQEIKQGLEKIRRTIQTRPIIDRDVAAKTAKASTKAVSKMGRNLLLRGVAGGIASAVGLTIIEEGLPYVKEAYDKVKNKAVEGIAEMEMKFKPKF